LSDFPRWRSHKTVEAFQIGIIIEGAAGSVLVSAPTEPFDPDPHAQTVSYRVHVDPLYVARHHPAVGGYYVRYADGYESFSPAAAFEAGYTRIRDGEETRGT
jgi:hypothetical protein